MPPFTVVYRNPGHWDICNPGNGRIFRIRGGPGNYAVHDERAQSRHAIKCKTVGACMAFICDELMHQLIVAEGQTPISIESWNV